MLVWKALPLVVRVFVHSIRGACLRLGSVRMIASCDKGSQGLTGAFCTSLNSCPFQQRRHLWGTVGMKVVPKYFCLKIKEMGTRNRRRAR